MAAVVLQVVRESPKVNGKTLMQYQNVGRARTASYAVLLLLLWLLGHSEPLSPVAVARAQPSSTASHCVVLQKLPLAVGFMDNLPIQSVPASGAALRDVLRGVKSWLCGPAMTSQSLNADSLRSAIEQHQTLLFEEVRFDTRQLKRAHVLLTDARLADDRKHTWRVQVDLASGTWKVTHAGETEPWMFSE